MLSALPPAMRDRAVALLEAALDLPPGERLRFLEQGCVGEPGLGVPFFQLLSSDGRLRDILDGAQARPSREALSEILAGRPHLSAVSTHRDPGWVRPMETIGPYRLLQKAGEGGMGEVWVAEQTEPVRRRVALKLVKAGMDSRQVLARFEAERQALALMDHSTIAKVYDAGVTPQGRPYFVMEYVQGDPITTYCDRQRLTMPERLALLLRVCDGVQHAHQKGIIHRDLKPGNVLVSLEGETPVPKIIDFGVAKATGARLTQRTMYTGLGILIGTPEYMSPEQADLTQVDVDTRTDVYSLGVILYELLTGTLPFDSKDLREGSFDELRRLIRQVEPPRPSTRARLSGEKAAEAARNRRVEPGRLAFRLKGDLDWIVMKALEKDRTRRYGSPAELAADIERHLKDQPVLAGPPGAAYRAGKFVRRHRFGVAATAAGALGLIGFAVTVSLQARRLAVERDHAERVSQFLVELLRVYDPGAARGNSVTAREVLDRSAEKLERELAGEPEIQARLMATIGWVYRNLGLHDKAEPLLTRAVQIHRELDGGEGQGSLTAMAHLGWNLVEQGRIDEAQEHYETMYEIQTRVLGPQHPDTIATLCRLGAVYERQGRLAEAIEVNRKGVALAPRILGEDHRDTFFFKSNLAGLITQEGRYVEAERMYRELYESRKRLVGEDHPDTLEVLHSLSWNHDAQGRADEAVAELRRELDALLRVLGAEHRKTLHCKSDLASLIARQGRHLEAGEAEQLHREASEGARRVLGSDHPEALIILHNLGDYHALTGRLEEAESVLEETLAARRRALGAEHPDTLATMDSLATLYARQGRHGEAERMFLETFEKKRSVHGESKPATQYTAFRLGCALALRGDRRDALQWLRRAVDGGYSQAHLIAGDVDCRSLRGAPEFEAVLSAARRNAGK